LNKGSFHLSLKVLYLTIGHFLLFKDKMVVHLKSNKNKLFLLYIKKLNLSLLLKKNFKYLGKEKKYPKER